jgi:hypothetical protein
MSDLLAPIYVVFDANEADAFWGLVGLMEMMVSCCFYKSPYDQADMIGKQLPQRSKRDEKTTINSSKAHRSDGSRFIRSSK